MCNSPPSILWLLLLITPNHLINQSIKAQPTRHTPVLLACQKKKVQVRRHVSSYPLHSPRNRNEQKQTRSYNGTLLASYLFTCTLDHISPRFHPSPVVISTTVTSRKRRSFPWNLETTPSEYRLPLLLALSFPLCVKGRKQEIKQSMAG